MCSSDLGLIDQCGGPEGFSLGRERLEQWLLEVAELPASEQHSRLKSHLMHFRGSEPQRDDITLLAFRAMQAGGATRRTGDATSTWHQDGSDTT